MIVVGIDPGMTGSFIAIDGNTLEYIDHLIAPTIKVGTKNRLNGAAVTAWLQGLDNIDHVFIEKVNAMPSGGIKMGAGSAFSFGHAAGYVEGIISGMGKPFTLVTPQQWKKAHSLIGTGKDEARSRCTQLYPALRVLDLKGKGQAVADAILIARYGITHTLKRNN